MHAPVTLLLTSLLQSLPSLRAQRVQPHLEKNDLQSKLILCNSVLKTGMMLVIHSEELMRTKVDLRFLISLSVQ